MAADSTDHKHDPIMYAVLHGHCTLCNQDAKSVAVNPLGQHPSIDICEYCAVRILAIMVDLH